LHAICQAGSHSQITMIFRFLIVLSIIVLVDLYFFQSLKTVTATWAESKRVIASRIYWGITISGAIFVLFSIITYKNPVINRTVGLYIFCFYMILLISKLIGSLPLMFEDIGRGVKWIVAFFNKGTDMPAVKDGMSRGKFISYSALTLAAIPFGTMIYGMVKTAFDFKIQRKKIPIAKLPAAFEGLKIVQISDIHSGSFISDAHFKNAVEIIMNEKPDLIFFTGDLVNDRSDEAEPFKKVWKNLSAPLGVFSVLGNHDYGDYVLWDSPELKQANLERLFGIHKEMGWELLRNEHRIIEKNGEKIGLVGVENWGAALRFPRKGDMKKAQLGMDEVPVKILLSHDPSHWEAKILKEHPEIDLTLSGHTHGFQFGIEIPGFKWSPSQYVYPQWAGLYSNGNQHLYVNRGLGFLGYLGRVGIRPEITVLELTASAV
jgi:predicted MPP superfamily phosphohydrolase